uniref:Uncharacterized protein n=1 Tax=Mycena chlorophos TaxID=658473 RepID=A0ABQ0L523_MYCCL|nr:predicted protein [Mycena chlorophos]
MSATPARRPKIFQPRIGVDGVFELNIGIMVQLLTAITELFIHLKRQWRRMPSPSLPARIIVSYDIACQWAHQRRSEAKIVPPAWSLAKGLESGRTDGEQIERKWAQQPQICSRL